MRLECKLITQVMARLSHYRHKKTAKKGLEAIRYISTCGTDADVDIMYKLLLLSKVRKEN